jgi:transposase
MKAKHSELITALDGRFDEHHGELARMLLGQIDALTTQIDTLSARIEALIAALPDHASVIDHPASDDKPGARAGAHSDADPDPTASTGGANTVRVDPTTGADCVLGTVERLDEIPGIGVHNAQAILAEIGVDISRFPRPRALGVVGQAVPAHHPVRAGHPRRQDRQGQPLPQRCALGEAAAAAAKTDTFLGERYRRLVKRRGKLKALVAVARSILVIIWHLLANPATRFRDLGPDYHTNRIATQRRLRNHIAQLSAMGYRVTLEPAA